MRSLDRVLDREIKLAFLRFLHYRLVCLAGKLTEGTQ